MNLTPSEFCKLLGIKKSAYYNKVNEKTEWTLSELIKLDQIKRDNKIRNALTVSHDGINYAYSVRKVA